MLVAAVHVQIDRYAGARAELALHAEALLPRELVLQIRRDLLDVARRQHRAGRERRQWVGKHRKRRVARRKGERHDAVSPQHRAFDDRENGILLREAPGAAVNGPLLIAAGIPVEADARIDVVLVGRSGPIGNVFHELDVVPHAVVQREVVADPPVVLHEAAEDPCLRVDDVLAGHERERLRVQIRIRRDCRPPGKVVDPVLIGQVALGGHVVGDAAAHLQRVGAAPQRHRVRDVPRVFGDDAPRAGGDATGNRVARAVELHAITFRRPQIVVARPLPANLVQDAVGHDRCPHVVNRVDVVRPDVPRAGQLQAAALVVLLPPHHVVADGQRLRRREPDVSADMPLILVGRRRNDRPRRFGRGHRHLASLAAPLVAAEEEHAVVDDRSAQIAAELLLIERHFLRGEGRDRVEVARPHHEERGAGVGVAPALGDHVHHAGRMAAELRRELVGDDLHLADGLEREAGRSALRRALQREPLREVARAVDVGAEVPHVAAADVQPVGAGAARDDVRVECQEAEVVALGDGQRREVAALDRPGHFRARRLDHGRVARNGHGLLHGREPERDVQHGALPGVERQVLAALGGKAGERGLQDVLSRRWKRREDVAAVRIRSGLAGEPGRHILQRHRGARQDALLRVGDDAFDVERGLLGSGRPRDRQDHAQDADTADQGAHAFQNHSDLHTDARIIPECRQRQGRRAEAQEGRIQGRKAGRLK